MYKLRENSIVELLTVQQIIRSYFQGWCGGQVYRMGRVGGRFERDEIWAFSLPTPGLFGLFYKQLYFTLKSLFKFKSV